MSTVSRAANWNAVTVLWQRDLLHFVRAPARVIAAVGQPLLLWFFLGAGFGSGFQVGSIGYLEFFFPGMVLLIVLFATIFTSMSIIEDRQQGFLRAVLAAPPSRSAVVLGKALGGATLATLQGGVILFFAPAAGIPLTPLSWLAAMGVLFLLSLSLSTLGTALAWRTDSTASFHAILNFALLPMWLLSGALFPVQQIPSWLGWVVRLDPLTYGLTLFRSILYSDGHAPEVGLANPMWVSWLVTIGFLLAMFGFALQVARKRDESR